MKQAVLVSNNPLIIDEFNSIAALANVQLIVTQQPTEQDLFGSERIFVDHESELASLNLLDSKKKLATHVETSLVLAGSATAQSWQIAAEICAQHIVLIPESRQWLVDYIKSMPNKLAKAVTLTSITGGAGSTTVALALARACAQFGRSVTLIDLDFQSVGLDIAAGCEKSAGLNWSTLQTQAHGADGDAIIAQLPEIAGVRVLANDQLNSYPEQQLVTRVIEQIRGNCDLVILDTGRWRAHDYTQEVDINEKYLVTPNTIRACAVAREILDIESVKTQRLIVREVPGSGLNPMTVAQTVDRPLAAVVPTDARICELSEQGLALNSNTITKFSRPISALTQQLLGEENALRVA